MPVRVSAISFLNPAPLLYNFEHEPAAAALKARYTVHYTSPARCAAELHAGEADLGLIPIAQLTPDLVVVPGCTIASQHEVRSILLLARAVPQASVEGTLRAVGSIAADPASRSSAAYVKTIFRKFLQHDPRMQEEPADAVSMLQRHDAALLIGDPALLARERKGEIDAVFHMQTGKGLLWLDVAQLWRRYTGLPWVAAVWAARAEALPAAGVEPGALAADLVASRDAGLGQIESLVREWTPRLPIPAETIRTYLTRNIYYVLDEPCLQAVRRFRDLASETGVLPSLPDLRFL